MPRTKLVRRRPATTAPFLASTLFPPNSPSLTQGVDELNVRASEMMRGAFAGFPEFPGAERFPALNVSEGKDEFTVTAELPGMTVKDVTIDYCDGVLSIRGEKQHEETKEEDDRTYYVWERRYGSFQRSLPFPGGINEDKITAEFKDGVLTVHLPKAEEAKAKHRAIAISGT
jgi:HSP20 family protein